MRLRRLTQADNIIINALAVALIVLAGWFAFRSPAFLTLGNLKIVLVNSSILAVVAAGLTLLIIAGKADLSIGSVIGFSSVMAALSANPWGWHPLASMLFAIACGAAVGAVNGLLCGVLGLNPIIVTLGMMTALRGLTQLIRQNPVNGLGGEYRMLGAGEIAGVPVLAVVAGAVFLLAAVVLYLTPWGRHTYAIGVSGQSAFLSALPVRRLSFLLYVAAGAASGLAGVMLAARLNGTDPGSAGVGMEFAALTVVLLGGVAFDGGRGKIAGVLLAVLFLGVLDNGLILLNVDQHLKEVIQGLALVLAAGLDVLGTRIAARVQAARRVADRTAPPSGPLLASAEQVRLTREM